MIYYKVKSKKENIRIRAKKEVLDTFKTLDNIFIAKELFTKKELERMLKKKIYKVFSFECDELQKNRYYYTFDEILATCFDIANINKNKTAFIFGARFNLEEL